MKITPIEIRQKSFEKKIRGFDKDEVNAFLLSISNEWERVMGENKETKIRLDQAEKEVQKLREVEDSLFKTLKTAEDTGANLVDQANKAAELHLKETEIRAEGLMSESKSKARAIIEKAEIEAKDMIEEMQGALKEMEKNYRMIENQRDNLIAELKNLTTDVMGRLERSKKPNTDFKVEDHMKRVRNMVRESEMRINEQKLEGYVSKTYKKSEINPQKDNNSVNQSSLRQTKRKITSENNDFYKYKETGKKQVLSSQQHVKEKIEALKTKKIADQKGNPTTQTTDKNSMVDDDTDQGSFFDAL